MNRRVLATKFAVYLCLFYAHTSYGAVSFVIQPTDVAIVFEHGSTETLSVVLQCKVADLQPTQKVCWLKNGQIISDDLTVRSGSEVERLVDHRYSVKADGVPGQYNLHISPINIYHGTFDAGQYKCAVLRRPDESYVIVSQSADVDIYVIPREEYPECLYNDAETDGEIIVSPGETTTLSCQSDLGTPRVSLDWYMDKPGEISQHVDWTSSGITNEGLAYIEYKSVLTSVEDGAIFTCYLQHPGYSVPGHERVNTNCTIGPFNVLHVPEVKVLPEENIVITSESEIVDFKCASIANPQAYRYLWFFNSVPLVENDSRFIISNGGRNLTIFGFSSEDNGGHHVSCTAENVLGNGTDTISVSVAIFPQKSTTEPQKHEPKTPISTLSTLGNTHFTGKTSPKSSSVIFTPEPKNAGNVVLFITIPICFVVVSLAILAIVFCVKFRRKKRDEPDFDQSFDNFTNETSTVDDDNKTYTESIISDEIKQWDTDTYLNVGALQIYENSLSNRSTTDSLGSRTDDEIAMEPRTEKNNRNADDVIYAKRRLRDIREESTYVPTVSQQPNGVPNGWIVDDPAGMKPVDRTAGRRSRRGDVFYI